MQAGSKAWEVISDATDAEAYEVFQRDRVWNCFAIADLVPPARAWTKIAIARETGGEQHAACLVLRHPELKVLSPYGAETGVATILETIDLPERTLAQAQSKHLSLIQRFYRLAPGWRELLRMGITPETFRPPPPSAQLPERLAPADLRAVHELYALFPGNHFRPDELRYGVYYGVREGDQLAAIGGTHAVAPTYGIAVLGGIFTHPDVRRRGYASAITAALVQELFTQGCTDVVLNVTADNTPAIRVYEHLGFRTHHRYHSGQADRLARHV